jgi:hypothetical protein
MGMASQLDRKQRNAVVICQGRVDGALIAEGFLHRMC